MLYDIVVNKYLVLNHYHLFYYLRTHILFYPYFQYSLCLLIFFLLEMLVAVIGFVFPHHIQATLEESFTEKIIHMYRDDADLQNLIDFAQQEVRYFGACLDGFIG